MNWLKDARIGMRLMAGFALVLLLLIGVTALALVEFTHLKADADYYDENTLPSVKIVHRVAMAIEDTRRFESQHIMLNAHAEKQDMEARIAKAREVARKGLSDYATMVSDDSDRKNYEAVKVAADKYFAVQDRLLELSRKIESDPKQAEAAQALLFGESRQVFQAALDAAEVWWQYNETLASNMSKASDASYRSANWTLIILAVIAVAASLVAAALITRSITRPVSAAVELARAVASGDLRQRVKAQSKDEVGQLIDALDEMTDNLSRAVGEVRQGVDAIATASTQIAQGNSDLSARTEQQASSLEETAASMEEMASTVRSSADSARQANQLASSTSDVAARGGDAVSQVVATMGEIQGASRRIADIIGVIDGIAFQTNILALNAAVEAARAGEQGRGFAVVASEVRNLAQRSAAAAREIKGLIGDSVAKVETGNHIVATAGSTIEDVVTQVRRVADLIAEVTSSATEQSQGVEQVNQAVTQLDQATQQNAALVEETAAATDSLRVQAQKLAQAVSVFKV